MRFLDSYLNKKNHRHELMIRFNADLQNLTLFLVNVTWYKSKDKFNSVLYNWACVVSIYGLGLWCLTPLQQYFSYIVAISFYWWRKPECPEKTTDLSQITGKTLSHNVVSSTPRLSGIRTHNVSGDRHWLHR